MKPPRVTIEPLVYLQWRHYALRLSTEVFFMGITPPDKPLHIERLFMPKQIATAASVEVNAESHRDFLIDSLQAGLAPSQFSTIFLHTHPRNMGVSPSGTDRADFEKFYGHLSYALMGIINGEGETSFTLSLRHSLGIRQEIDCEFQAPSLWACIEAAPLPNEAWRAEALANISEPAPQNTRRGFVPSSWSGDLLDLDDSDTFALPSNHNQNSTSEGDAPIATYYWRGEPGEEARSAPIPLFMETRSVSHTIEGYSQRLSDFLRRHIPHIPLPTPLFLKDNSFFICLRHPQGKGEHLAVYRLWYTRPSGEPGVYHLRHTYRDAQGVLRDFSLYVQYHGQEKTWTPMSDPRWLGPKFEEGVFYPDATLNHLGDRSCKARKKSRKRVQTSTLVVPANTRDQA